MTIAEMQSKVDQWIANYGVRYFNELTNTVVLAEEVGEFCRLVAREYGEQSFKPEREPGNIKESLADEMADILFVLTCLANQMDIDLTDAFKRTLAKKTSRDINRHQTNQKLRS